MNKTVIFVTFATLAALGIIGSVILYIIRPDASASFIGNLITILGLVSVAAGTFHGLNKANDKLEKVEKQTNGTLSSLLEENLRKELIIKNQTATIATLKEKNNE